MNRTDARPPRGIPRSGPPTIARIVVLSLLLLAAARPGVECRQSGTPLSIKEFRERVEAFLADTGLSRAIIGLKIVRLDDTTTVAEVNPGKLLHPASNMKIITTAAALAILPRGYSFRTTVSCDAGIDGADLDGNLYVTGGGDPLLDTNDVDSIAAIVAGSGIRRIGGDIVGDLSRFDTLSWGEGWMWDDEPDPDEAFVSPLSFNHASVSVVVGPGPREGAPLACTPGPAAGSFTVDNLSATLGEGTPDSLVVTRARGANTIIVRGAMGLSSLPETTMFSVRSPALHLLEYLRERLLARGVETEGVIRTGETAGAIFLGRIERPLDSVLTRINKISDNLAAECLLKTLSLETSGVPGTSEGGLAAVGAYLSGTGIDPGTVITADGSGVSWYNAVAPGDIIAVLRDQYSRKSTFGEFYRSLARAGYDGTLAARLKGSASAGRISGKTGTLTGVSTLSGYVTTLSHDLLAFSVMVNHYPGKLQALRSWQDALLDDLVRLDPDL